MKRSILKYAGIFLLVGAGLVYLYAHPIINQVITEGVFSKFDYRPGINDNYFNVKYGYLWFIPIMAILGIFYLLKKEKAHFQAGALIHFSFAIAIGLYGLIMIIYPNDEIFELIIIVNSWLLIIAGVVALLFQPSQPVNTIWIPHSATKSLLMALPIVAILLFPIDFGSEGGLVKIGQFLLSLVLIIPIHLSMKWIWKLFA